MQSTPVRLTLHYFLCGSCGYGVAVKDLPAACPMCRGLAWVELDVERKR